MMTWLHASGLGGNGWRLQVKRIVTGDMGVAVAVLAYGSPASHRVGVFRRTSARNFP